MTVLISGGVKNGKSYHAQRIAYKLSKGRSKYYLATMIPHDLEDECRISRHIHDREGWGFETIECPRDIINCLDKSKKEGVFLLDSTTALLSNEMFLDNGKVNHGAPEKIVEEIYKLIEIVGGLVIVSDFIYSDTYKYDELTEEYRKGLAYIDCALAQKCDVVLEICCGNVFCHKGDYSLCT